MLSELARQALTQATRATPTKEAKSFYGFHPLPRVPGKIVTNEMINRLRKEDIY